MAGQSKPTETAKKATTTVRTSTASDAPTGQPDQRTATTQQTTQQRTQTTQPSRPAPSPRSGIRLNTGLVENVVETGGSSRAVKAIQYALADRGFDPGRRDGIYDQATKDAYARFQSSIDERDTGVPTAFSLDYLGFDLI